MYEYLVYLYFSYDDSLFLKSSKGKIFRKDFYKKVDHPGFIEIRNELTQIIPDLNISNCSSQITDENQDSSTKYEIYLYDFEFELLRCLGLNGWRICAAYAYHPYDDEHGFYHRMVFERPVSQE